MKRYTPSTTWSREYLEMVEDPRGAWVRYKAVECLDELLAGDSIVIEDQARLLRQCRYALEQLLEDNPKLVGRVYGSTTLGNLKAELAQYRSER